MAQKIKSLGLRLAPWVLVWGAALLVYFPAVKTFFSQDDFTHLYISQANSWAEFFKFFVPVKTGVFYRPLSIQIYTWLSRRLFGLNPAGFHWVALVFHLANIYLVYQLMKKLLESEILALALALVYGVHVSHFMSIFWISEFSMVLAPFFAFLAINCFLEKRYYQVWLWIFWGLLANELVAIVPLVLVAYSLVQHKRGVLKWLIVPWVNVASLMLVRLAVFPVSLGKEYVLSLKPSIWLANWRWHIYRAMGLTEGLRAHLNLASLRFSLLALAIAWLIWAISLILAFKWHKLTGRKWSLLVWGGLWFWLSVLPVSFLAHHQSPIYQIIGLPGFLLMLAAVLPKISQWSVSLVAFLSFYVAASFWGVRAQSDYHWITQRSRLAYYHLTKLEKHRPSSDDRLTFLNTLPHSSTQVYLALAGEYGPKVFFGQEIEVLFEDFTEAVFAKNAVYILSRQEL